MNDNKTGSYHIIDHEQEALARLRFLRTLCITQRPLLQTDYNINDRRYRYQKMADGIFSYLDQRSSPIRILVFKPAHSYALPGNIAVDANVHPWPDYAYQKAICMSVLQRVHRVVAEPVNHEQIRLFEPYLGHLC